MSGTARLSDLALQIGPARWAMVRTHFGIQAFGVNAWIAAKAGEQLIGEHDEVGDGAGQHEELYFLAEGHATFTVDGDEIDAPAGTFVFVRDPAAKRKAVAKEDGTAVVVIGGKPGEAFTPSPWERSASALVHFATKEYGKAIEVLEQQLAETPDDPRVLYNLACAESLTGETHKSLEHLARAVGLHPEIGEMADKDSDFDAIRDDPKFASAIAGQPDSGGSSS